MAATVPSPSPSAYLVPANPGHMGRTFLAKWIARAALALLALLAAGPAGAQAGAVGEPVPVCVRRADPGLDPLALLARPAGFDCAAPQTAFGPGDYYVVSRPLGVAANWPARVRSASVWQDRVTLHALYADGRVATVRSDGRDIARRIQLGAIFQHVLPARGVPIVRLLWRVEGSANLRGIVLDPRVAKPSEEGRSNLLLAGLYAGFGGLCFALLFYNLALWGALRHRFLLFYCLMTATLLVYGLSSSGALAWIVPDIHNNDRLRINNVTLAVAAVSALLFARSFFEPRVFAGWVGRAADLVSVYLMVAAVALSALEPLTPRLLDRLYATGFLAVMALIGPVLWRAWTRRSAFFGFFCVGWSIPVLFAGLRIAHSFDLLPWSFWLDNSTLLAMTAESLLSSLAIAYRIRLLSRDRDRAREEEVAARLLADTDPLTGLLNRRAFLRTAIGRTGEHALLLIDVDHFKSINDAVGHDAGDDVLRAVARALAVAAGAHALVARVGGEEFAIVAPAVHAPDPVAVLATLRAEPMPYDLVVTASIGVAGGPLSSEADWKTLYRDADRALFDAKRSGRDRVRRAVAAVA